MFERFKIEDREVKQWADQMTRELESCKTLAESIEVCREWDARLRQAAENLEMFLLYTQQKYFDKLGPMLMWWMLEGYKMFRR